MNSKKRVTKKSFSRFFAVQILFAYLTENDSNITDLINFIENYYISEEFSLEDNEEYKKNVNIEFMNELLENTVKNLEAIDIELSAKLPEKYTIEKIDPVITNIIRLAVYENNYTDTPRNVVISEYVDIAGEYFDSKGTSFVNAMLDNLLNKKNEEI